MALVSSSCQLGYCQRLGRIEQLSKEVSPCLFSRSSHWHLDLGPLTSYKEVLSGCGYLDGTEIYDAMATTFHISKGGMVPTFYAPNVNICTVIDHCSKEIDGSSRNALVESARLARSKIKDLSECNACAHAALIIPGGFGAAKILSDFAVNGACCTVLPDVEKVIEDFNCAKKPIGTMSIATAVVARLLKDVKVTLGKASPKEDWPFSDAIGKVKEMGAKVEMKDVKGVTYCKKQNVFSTPTWLYKPASYAVIHSAIGKMISMMKKDIKRRQSFIAGRN